MESIKRRFAWWPKRVTSGKWVWLKHYYESISMYDASTGRPPLTSLYFVYTETEQEYSWNVLKYSIVQNRNVWNTPELTKQDKI